jgi:flavin-dependent dehydrogenase
MTSPAMQDYDAIVIGGGPGGTTTAMVMARAGLKVCLLEKDQHPRFHIGESFLPRNMEMLRDLGLEEELLKLPHLTKLGAEFGMGNDHKTMTFRFDSGLLPKLGAFNIERSIFDAMLLEHAKKAGVVVLENTAVRGIHKLENGRVEVATAGKVFGGRVLMDASGQGTVVGRHLGIRRNVDDPELKKVAYFQQFNDVERLPGDAAGHPSVFMADEGWFWVIGRDEKVTSVGFVTRPDFTKQLNVPADRVLQWAIARCPVVRDRMRNATGEPTNRVFADFSYVCSPNAGPGYFLVGDAACFLDPIFSTGVTLAMVGGNHAAKLAIAMLRGEISPAKAQKDYSRFVTGSTTVFWRLIRNYYRHSFRELFLEGRGPHDVHRAVISTLAGEVFPQPVWALRWRIRLFEMYGWIQRFVPLAPRRPRFSLVQEAPIPLAGVREVSMAK